VKKWKDVRRKDKYSDLRARALEYADTHRSADSIILDLLGEIRALRDELSGAKAELVAALAPQSADEFEGHIQQALKILCKSTETELDPQ
jgi:hypothetical protein